jgi:hypothetical protein
LDLRRRGERLLLQEIAERQRVPADTAERMAEAGDQLSRQLSRRQKARAPT